MRLHKFNCILIFIYKKFKASINYSKQFIADLLLFKHDISLIYHIVNI